MATESSRKDIIDCLYDWQLSYKITGNYAVIDSCIAELVGEKKLNWFNYSELNEFDNNDACNQLNFDAKTELINLLNIKNNSNNYTWENIRGRVFSSLSTNFTNELNDILKETAPSVKKDKLIQFIKKCEKCYLHRVILPLLPVLKKLKKPI